MTIGVLALARISAERTSALAAAGYAVHESKGYANRTDAARAAGERQGSAHERALRRFRRADGAPARWRAPEATAAATAMIIANLMRNSPGSRCRMRFADSARARTARVFFDKEG